MYGTYSRNENLDKNLFFFIFLFIDAFCSIFERYEIKIYKYISIASIFIFLGYVLCQWIINFKILER